jgi:uncharacterized caspase-like protein
VQPEQRLALVIGNATYKEAPLRNAANDARAIAAVLKDAGFTVQLHTDADHRSMVSALRVFGDQLRKGGGVGIFYFAGHGMQIRGRNYLVPVGADIQREDEVAYNALDAQAVLDKMEAAGNGTNLMILDACRNNPFARSFRSSAQGLAQMDAPVGSLVAFATAPGSVASDGPDANGLYTQHLLRAMRQRGAKVEDVFKQVRSAVRRESQGKQVPWEATSLEGDLYFFTPQAAAAAAEPPPAPTRPAAPSTAAVTLPAAAPASDERERRTAQLLAELARPAAGPVSRPRPAAVPASNAQGFTVGDVWNYQVVDRWRGEVVRNYAQRVQKIEPDGGWVNAGGERQDALGRPTRYRGADGVMRQVTPHAPRWWPDMKPGERRRFDWEESGTRADGSVVLNRHEGDVTFVGVETVKVPAGEFQAQRFEYKGVNTAVGASGRGTLALVAWFVPDLHTMVAREREISWNGRLELRERDELTSYALTAARPP